MDISAAAGDLATGALSTGANMLFNHFEAKAQRDWSSREAQKGRDFLIDASLHEYGRKRQSMEEAGINPVVAFSGGMGGGGISSAPTASGGATASNHSAIQGPFLGAANLALQAELVRAQAFDLTSSGNLKQIDAQTRAAENIARIDEIISRIDNTKAKTASEIEYRKNLIKLRDQIIADTTLIGAKTRETQQNITESGQRVEESKSRTKNIDLERPKLENEAEAEKDTAKNGRWNIQKHIRQARRTLGLGH